MDIKELRTQSKTALDTLYSRSKNKLHELQFSLSAKQLKNVREVREVRKLIAKINTVLKEMK